jgi:hypothetical protein
MQSHFRLKLLVASIAMAATASLYATPASNVSSAFVALPTQTVNTLRNGDVSTGPLAFSQPMHVVVSLKLRNKAQLDSFVAKAEQPGTAVADRSMSAGGRRLSDQGRLQKRHHRAEPLAGGRRRHLGYGTRDVQHQLRERAYA